MMGIKNTANDTTQRTELRRRLRKKKVIALSSKDSKPMNAILSPDA
jgi:hypothetical protein